VKVAVTGSSGLIGSALIPALRAEGHEVLRLVRRPAARPDEVAWQPDAGQLDREALAGTEAGVNLAGAGIGDRRWTEAYKRRLVRSRVDSTRTVARAMAEWPGGPRVLLSASAVGWYGDTGDRTVDETAPAGQGFLAQDVVRPWEDATGPAEEAGMRVVHLRSGIVLSAKGGALGKVLPLFRVGAGPRLGSGRQYVSWIALPDQIAAIRFLLHVNAVHGAVNLTAPNPVTNAEYTKAIARAVHRPAVLTVPSIALRIVLGGFADEGVLIGQRVLPAVLLRAGFTFRLPTIDAALEDLLGDGMPRPGTITPPLPR
jgi:uncharacterized protein